VREREKEDEKKSEKDTYTHLKAATMEMERDT